MANLPDGTVKLKLTTAEAETLIKQASRRPGVRFALHVSIDAPIANDPDHVFHGGLRHYLNLTKRQALDMVRNLLREGLEERGARIPISRYTSYGSTTYWIG